MSNFPIRMNLVDVEIPTFNKIETLMDIDFLEPVGSKKYNTGASVTKIKGQVNYGRTELQTASMSGDVEVSDGHLIFKQGYLDQEGVVLKKGDLISKIAGRDVSFKIIELRPQAVLNGSPILLYAFFQENKEVREVA